MNTLGERLKKAIKDANLTQKEVAKALNIPEATLSNFIKNKYEPGVYKIKQLADFLSVDLNWLITGKSLEERIAEDIGVQVFGDNRGTINSSRISVGEIKEGGKLIIQKGSKRFIERRSTYQKEYVSEIIQKLDKMSPEQRKKVLKFIDEFIFSE